MRTENLTNHEPSHATEADFCEIFQRDMNHLYLLSFLLTANEGLAEKCFVRALEDSISGSPVFAEGPQSSAPRMIIRNAVQMIHPGPANNGAPNSMAERNIEHALTKPAEFARILEMPAFDRFAFVMSMLEGYSDRESSLLLDCTPSEFVAARIRAIQQIGKSGRPYVA
jgi:hypothetical protein